MLTKRNTLLFSGDISLENNGGFASIRSNTGDMSLDGASGITVKARGDGRTYWVGLRTPRQYGASSYRAYLPTSKDTFTETFIPIGDFKLQAFGRQIPGRRVDPAAITSLGFTLADKKAGPFQLEIESIEAVFEDEPSAKPGSTGTIVDVAAEAGSFKTLLAAAAAADLAGALSGEAPLTVFAPTDEAFAKLPGGTVESLLKPENRQKLQGILKYHVLAGRIPLAAALKAGQAETLQGQTLPIAFTDGRVRIGPALLSTADLEASNGIIHVIDQVLLPPETPDRVLAPDALIELAIERGVPLFNNGNPAACRAIYEVACEALRAMPSICEHSREDLGRALNKMRAEPGESRKAWILRHALDRVLSR